MPTYEIAIYIIGQKDNGLLNEIKEVDYYLGERFGRSLGKYGAYYKVRNGNDGFAVRLTANGPTLCIARVRFHDGKKAMLTRYLDFEGTGYRYKEMSTEKA